MNALIAKDIIFSYTPGRRVLNDISAGFATYRTTGIIGPNGCGKSTLLSILTGIIRPDGGGIYIDGQPIARMSANERARHIALVPQYSHMDFDFTVLDIVRMGRSPHARRFHRDSRRDDALARHAIEDMGLTSLMDRPVTALSGGEWQRVVVARAICQDAGIMLLDEPVTGLDIKYQMRTLDFVRDWAHKNRATAVCVLHDLGLAAQYCDDLIMMKDGAVFAAGAPREVLTKENIRAVYGVDVRIREDSDGYLYIRPMQVAD